MEKTILGRFISSHDKLIYELRNQIDKLNRITESRQQLHDYKLLLESQISDAADDHKNDWNNKENQYHVLCQQLKKEEMKKNQLVDQFANLRKLQEDLIRQRNVFMEQAEESTQSLDGSQMIYDKMLVYVKETADDICKLKQQTEIMKQKITIQLTDIQLIERERQEISKDQSDIIAEKQELFGNIENMMILLEELSSSNEEKVQRLKLLACQHETMIMKEQQKQTIKKNQINKGAQISQNITKTVNKIEYSSKILSGQKLVFNDLQATQSKLIDIHKRKLTEIEKVIIDNEKISAKIQKKQLSYEEKINMNEKLKLHIQSLQNANHLMYKKMKQSCLHDNEIVQIFKLKQKSLNGMEFQVRETNKPKTVLRQRTNLHSKKKIKKILNKNETTENSEIQSSSTFLADQ